MPVFVLWLVYLYAGLVPEWVFGKLRELGNVTLFDALVNSPWVITWLFAAYMALFVLRACRQQEVDEADALGRAFQVGILAVVAFWPDLMGPLLMVGQIQEPFYRGVIYLCGAAKVAAWFYLFVYLFRYYCFDNLRVFADMLCIFGSSCETPMQQTGGDPEMKREGAAPNGPKTP